jgi:hydroxymethylpyrimidine/phosphomethylpyrimidine kinase
MRIAMTIAGSDSSGGAGIQADLKTFTVLGCFGTSAVTALTAQNTTGVAAVAGVDVAMIVRQIDFTVADVPPHATKTGMLAGTDVVEAVADAVARHRLPHYVCDPVLTAKSGARLVGDEVLAAIRARLLPLAEVITPNRFEAAALAGVASEPPDERAAVEIGRRLRDAGARAALIKAIPAPGARRVDLLVIDGAVAARAESDELPPNRNHGSGCVLSAALCARLALGDALADAATFATAFARRAIATSPEIGRGVRPVNAIGAGAIVASPGDAGRGLR